MSQPLDLDAIGDAVSLQPELGLSFGDDAPMLEPGILAEARRFSAAGAVPRHTGKNATRDERRCVVAYAMLQAGLSRNDICKQLRMHKNTLRNLEEEFERGGKLEPLKDRITVQLRIALAEAIEEMRRALELPDRKDSDRAAWLRALAGVVANVYDRHALATGLPTENIGHVGPAPRQGLEAWYASVTDAEVVSDPKSLPAPLTSNGLHPSSTVQETVPAGSGAAPGSLDSPQQPPGSRPAPPAAPPAAPPQAGGGVAPDAPPTP